MIESSTLYSTQPDIATALNIIHPVHQEHNVLQPFAHAVKLAQASKGALEIIDVRSKDKKTTETPSVRTLLEQWGVLPAQSTRSAVADLGLKVTKIIKSGNKKREITKRFNRHDHDILVIGTQPHKHLPRFFGTDLEELLAQYFNETTLFIPQRGRSFVHEKTGAVSIDCIVVPVAESTDCEPSFHLLKQLISLFPDLKPKVIGLHVGVTFPHVSPSLLEGINWSEVVRPASISSSIIDVANAEKADLILMTTNGRDSLSQKIIGSNTEQVLRHAPCPLFAVPLN